MDYGPFGWMERFEKVWNMWAGSGDHFGFLNQPAAGGQNLKSLGEALYCLMEDEMGRAELQDVVDAYDEAWRLSAREMWKGKMGLQVWNADAGRLIVDMFDMMQDTRADYTILWRQLAEMPLLRHTERSTDKEMFAPLRRAFDGTICATDEAKIVAWTRRWLALVQQQGGDAADVSASMKLKSPKYVPREWMLVEAYTAAQDGDYELLHGLHKLFENPYAEQPEFEDRYYRKVPDMMANRGGVAFMS